MPAKWFCNDCGAEIWQGLSQNQKDTETVAEMERTCMCTDCIIKNGGFKIYIEEVLKKKEN